MQENFELNATVRTDSGKGASRRLRRVNGVPAIIYGGNQEPQNITLKHNELAQHLAHESFYSHILTMIVDGKSEKVVLRDLQRHPARPIVMHADFMRVNMSEVIRMHVPLHFLNEETAHGVKQQGGIVAHLATDVEVSCKASDLPEYLEVDLSDLKLGESVHLSQIKLPAGVEIVALTHGPEHDLAVVSIHKTRATAAEGEGEAAAGEGESGEQA